MLSELNIAGVQVRQVEGTSLISQKYCDEVWIDSANDRKHTSIRCFSFENSPIYWVNKKQNCVSLCSTEIDYIAKGSSCSQLIWVKPISQEYNVKHDVN